MKTIAVASLKGGCGKTSTAVFLAQTLSHKGYRVLIIDLDHNNNTTDFFLRSYDPEQLEKRNMYHYLTGKVKFEDILYPEYLGITIAPCTPTIAQAGIELAHNGTGALRLAGTLLKQDFDYCVIDTPPALCLELSTGLYAADLVLCPVQDSRWTLQGYMMLRHQLADIEETKGAATVLLALPSMVTEKETAIIRKIPVWNTTKVQIMKSATIRKAGTIGKPLASNTKVFLDFLALAEELTVWL